MFIPFLSIAFNQPHAVGPTIAVLGRYLTHFTEIGKLPP